jgi:crossover junction endodeoxyribonuclease RuvC
MRILAIDPGFDRVGIAVVEKEHGRESVVHSQCIVTNRANTFPDRLLSIERGVEDVIREYTPTLCAIEELYMAANKTTGIRVAEARGVIIATAARAGLSVRDISPLQVKMAVTGYGKADKTQINMMIHKTILLPEGKKLDDEIDAIAIGVAALAMFGKSAYPQTY